MSLRYTKGDFDEGQESTISAAYLEKKVNIGKQSVTLNIYDTAGQERFHSLAPIYFRNAHGALLVYDITDYPTFERVQRWVVELQRMAAKDICIVICGNKSDLEDKQKVKREEAELYAKKVGAKHVPCSAKTAMGVEKAFFLLTQAMLQKEREAEKKKLVNNVHIEKPPPKEPCC